MDEDYYQFTATSDELTVVQFNYPASEGDIDLQVVIVLVRSLHNLEQPQTTKPSSLHQCSLVALFEVWLYQDAGSHPGNQYSCELSLVRTTPEGFGNNTVSDARLINTEHDLT